MIERFMITKDQARDLATRHAFTVDDPEASDHGRTILHCWGSFTGADWDLSDVLAEIDGARACAFLGDDIFDHCLAVQPPEENGRYRTWRFSVPAEAGEGLTPVEAPEEVEA